VTSDAFELQVYICATATVCWLGTCGRVRLNASRESLAVLTKLKCEQMPTCSVPVVDLLNNAAASALPKSEGELHKQHPETLHLLPQLSVLSSLIISCWGGGWGGGWGCCWGYLAISSRLPGRASRVGVGWWLPSRNGRVRTSSGPRGHGGACRLPGRVGTTTRLIRWVASRIATSCGSG